MLHNTLAVEVIRMYITVDIRTLSALRGNRFFKLSTIIAKRQTMNAIHHQFTPGLFAYDDHPKQ